MITPHLLFHFSLFLIFLIFLSSFVNLQVMEKAFISNQAVLLPCKLSAHQASRFIWRKDGDKMDVQVINDNQVNTHLLPWQPRDTDVHFFSTYPKNNVEKKREYYRKMQSMQAEDGTRVAKKVAPTRQRVYIDASNGSLVFRVAKEEDEGVYRCFAEVPNNLSSALFYQPYTPNYPRIAMGLPIKLRRAFHNVFNKTGHTRHFTPRVGESLKVQCQSPSSFPPAEVSWALDTPALPEPIGDDSRIDWDFEGNLYISNIEERDWLENRYLCLSYNPFQGSTTYDDGFILSSPNSSSFSSSSSSFSSPYQKGRAAYLVWSSPSSDTAVLGRHKNLKCIFAGNPTPRVSWYKVEESSKLFLGEGNELFIQQVTANHSGLYECKAENKFEKNDYINEKTNLRRANNENASGQNRKQIHLQVETEPHWVTPPPPYLTIDVDFVHVMSCDVAGTPTPSIQWFINGVIISEASKYQQSSYKVRGENELEILKKTGDGAMVQCEASNPHAILISNTYLHILESEPTFDQQPQNTKAIVGWPSVTFHCRLSGSPKPQLDWLRGENGANIRSDGSKYQIDPSGDLIIKNVESSDEGTYHCRGSNRFGSKAHSLLLSVFEMPEQDNSLDRIIITQKKKSTMLRCPIKTEHLSNFTVVWLKNAVPLSRAQLSDKRKYDGEKNELLIKEVGNEDIGVYKCVLKWQGFPDIPSYDIEIFVKDVPSAPYDVQLLDCSNPTFIRLSYVVGFHGYEEINSCHVTKITLPPDNTTEQKKRRKDGVLGGEEVRDKMILSRRGYFRSDERIFENVLVQPWKKYRLSVYCTNNIGNSLQSSSIECTTVQTLPSKNPPYVCVRMGGPHQLIIVWQPLTQDDLNGEDFYYKVTYRQSHDGADEHTQEIHDYTASELIISNQQTFSMFYFSVQAANSQGTRELLKNQYYYGFSSEQEITEVPQKLRVSVVNGSIHVWWRKARNIETFKGFIKGYKIKVWKVMDPSQFFTEEIWIENEKDDKLCGVRKEKEENLKNFEKRQTSKQLGSEVLNSEIEVDDDWLNEELFVAIRLATASQDGPLSQPIRIKINVEGVKKKHVLSLHEVGSNHILFSWGPKNSSAPQSTSIDKHKKFFSITLMNHNKHIVFSTRLKHTLYKNIYFYKMQNLLSSHEYTLKINSKENEQDSKFKGSKMNVVWFKTRSATQGLDAPSVNQVKLLHQNHYSFSDNQVYDDVIVTWFSSPPLTPSLSSPSNLVQNPPSEHCIQYKPANLMGDSSWTSVNCHLVPSCPPTTPPHSLNQPHSITPSSSIDRNDFYSKSELLNMAEVKKDNNLKEKLDSKIQITYYNTSYNDIMNGMHDMLKDRINKTNFDVEGLFYWSVVSIPRTPDSGRVSEFRVVGVSILESCSQSIVYSEPVAFNLQSIDDSFLHFQILSTTWAVVGIIIIFISVFIIVVIITILLASGNKHIYLVSRKEKTASKQGMKVLLDTHSNNYTYRQTLPVEDEEEGKVRRNNAWMDFEKGDPNENDLSKNYKKSQYLKSTFYGDLKGFENNEDEKFMEKNALQRAYKNVISNENCCLDDSSKYNTLCLSTIPSHNEKLERNNSLTDPKIFRHGLKKNINIKDENTKKSSEKMTLAELQTKSFSKHNALVLDTLV